MILRDRLSDATTALLRSAIAAGCALALVACGPDYDSEEAVVEEPLAGEVAPAENFVATTDTRLDMLGEWGEGYYERMGRAPATLDEFAPAETDPLYARAAEYRMDAWNRPFRWTYDNQDWELRSAGPDGIFDNEDDLIETGDWE